MVIEALTGQRALVLSARPRSTRATEFASGPGYSTAVRKPGEQAACPHGGSRGRPHRAGQPSWFLYRSGASCLLPSSPAQARVNSAPSRKTCAE